ncbi:hypothetical protein H0H81_006874 [Sphagnurus paluster]|uniref:Uncharacterized protein n=1 Tax=Sphagnurus paluster TaxID=117069 RepID=A0A9P7GWI6_9AGAR|nr:hypothetical protein H0H81_006874 [Sphagnurus paluster]
MRSSLAFFILAASGRPSLVSIISAACAHPLHRSDDTTNIRPHEHLSKRHAPSQHHIPNESFLTPTIIISFILFLLFTASIISLICYGPEIRLFIQRKLGRIHGRAEPKRVPTAETDTDIEAPPSYGFGFDGLTAAEMQIQLYEEEKRATAITTPCRRTRSQGKSKPKSECSEVFIPLPVSSPSLVLKHHSEPPLSPIEVIWNHEDLGGALGYAQLLHLDYPVKSMSPSVSESGESSTTMDSDPCAIAGSRGPLYSQPEALVAVSQQSSVSKDSAPRLEPSVPKQPDLREYLGSALPFDYSVSAEGEDLTEPRDDTEITSC